MTLLFGTASCVLIVFIALIKENISQPYIAIGPYADTANRNLPYGPHDWGYTSDTCYDACFPEYEYFALQASGWCCCGNNFTRATRDGPSSCGTSGGGWCNYIYQATGFNWTYAPTTMPTEIPSMIPTQSPTISTCNKKTEILFTSIIKMDDWAAKTGRTSWRLISNNNDIQTNGVFNSSNVTWMDNGINTNNNSNYNSNFTVYYSDNSTNYDRNTKVLNQLCLLYSVNCFKFELFDTQGDGLSDNYKKLEYPNNGIDYWLYLDQFKNFLIESSSWNNGSYLNIDFCISMCSL